MLREHDVVYTRLFGGSPGQARIGRYLVRGTLGQGGMGKVLRVHDETLGRDVALKVLHEGRGSRHEQRLLREAQALAKLEHPNVVRVYDVHEIEGQLCMAMELVEGESLQRWQAKPRPWPEVLEVYMQAGRGLAAAHARGLVHRDFKPSNCVLDPNGLVKVLDFGLARGAAGDSDEMSLDSNVSQESAAVLRPVGVTESLGSNMRSSSSILALRSQRMLEADLTRTGAMLGTVAYMAPEQLLGKPATAASDEFSFCVSMYEALYGRRPFRGRSAMSTLYAIQSKRVRSESARSGMPPVPRWLFDVLRRGLSVASHERYPSLDELLDALERGLRRRRRVRTVALSGMLLATMGAGLGLSGVLDGERPCDGLREAVMPAWSSDDRAAVQTAIDGSGLVAAAQVRELVEAGLDDYARSWTEARADACEATWVRHEAGEQVLARRMACLDERVPRMKAVVARLADADIKTAAHAVSVVEGLPPLEPCADAEALLQGPELIPAALASEAAEIRELLAQSWVAGEVDDHNHGVEAAERAVEAAERIEDRAPGLLLEALHNRGHLYRSARRFAEARADLERALAEAERLDDRRRAIDVLQELIFIAGDERDERTAAAWLASIRGKLARSNGDDEPRGRAQLSTLEGLVAMRAGRLDEAVKLSARSVDLYESMEQAPADERIQAMLQLGEAHRRVGDAVAAQVVLEQAMEAAEQQGRIPLMTLARYKLAFVHYNNGRPQQAIELLEPSLELLDAFYGPVAVASARDRTLLAQVLRIQGKLDAAFEQATLASASLDDRSPARLRAEVASLLAGMHRSRRQWEPAIEHYRQARSAWAESADPSRLQIANIDGNIADCLAAKGDYEEAEAIYESTMRVLLVETEPGDPRRAYLRLGIGEFQLSKGRPELAIGELRRVLSMEVALSRDPSLGAKARWALARALRSDPASRTAQVREAAALAREARVAYKGAGIEETVTEVDQWLADCGRACATAP
ncbi:MAG: serine/threonine-protein kinase [Nannocystaceae bacterium]